MNTKNVFMYFFAIPRLSLQRTGLLKQQLSKMASWVSKAEQKIKDEPDIGTNYDTVKEQLEKHQVIKTSRN